MEITDFLILGKTYLGERFLLPLPNQANSFRERTTTLVLCSFSFSSTPFIASPMGHNVIFIGQPDASIMTVFTIGHTY